MKTAEILSYLYFAGVIVWILPPIRQYKGYMFDFFLVLAIIDPASLLYGFLTRTNLPLWLVTLFIYLLIISVTTEELLKRFRYIFISLPLLFVLFIPYMSTMYYHIVFISMDAILLFVFLKWFITAYVATNKLNVFYLMLVFYMLTVILKFFNLLIGFADASTFFFTTTFAQIIFGLFFSFVREGESGIAH